MIVNHSARVNSLHVVNLLRVPFLVRWGPLGNTTDEKGSENGGANENLPRGWHPKDLFVLKTLSR